MAEFWTVKVTDDLAWLIRTDRRPEDLDAFIESFDEIFDGLDGRAPSSIDAVFDLRVAIGRNDDAFERAIAPRRREVFAAFRRASILVRTEAGRMQVRRHFIEEGITPAVFVDPDEAVAWLTSQNVSSS